MAPGEARRVTAIPLERRLPGASSNLPGRQDPDIDPGTLPPLARRLCSTPSLFGFAPGGVCRAACVAASAVRSYRTVSPLPRRPHPTLPRLRGREREGAGRGGLFSVALSLGSPPPDVIRHRMSMEPGLSSPAPPYPRESGAERRAGAAVRPTDDSRNGVWRRLRQAPRKRFRLAILAALALHRAHPENLS